MATFLRLAGSMQKTIIEAFSGFRLRDGVQVWRKKGAESRVYLLVPVLTRGLTLTYSELWDTARQSTHTDTLHNNRRKIKKPRWLVLGLVDSRKVVSRDARRLPSELSAVWHQRQLFSWPCVRFHCGSDDRMWEDRVGGASRLTVLECLPATWGWLVWTSFLAAPFGEAIPWPTLRGEPSGLASMARP